MEDTVIDNFANRLVQVYVEAGLPPIVAMHALTAGAFHIGLTCGVHRPEWARRVIEQAEAGPDWVPVNTDSLLAEVLGKNPL